MRLENDATANPDLRALLEENLKLSRAIYVSSEKTRRYILWGQVLGLLKVLIIIVPLVLGFLYLRPYLDQVIQTYQQLLGAEPSQPGESSNLFNQLKLLQSAGKLNNLNDLQNILD